MIGWQQNVILESPLSHQEAILGNTGSKRGAGVQASIEEEQKKRTKHDSVKLIPVLTSSMGQQVLFLRKSNSFEASDKYTK